MLVSILVAKVRKGKHLLGSVARAFPPVIPRIVIRLLFGCCPISCCLPNNIELFERMTSRQRTTRFRPELRRYRRRPCWDGSIAGINLLVGHRKLGQQRWNEGFMHQSKTFFKDKYVGTTWRRLAKFCLPLSRRNCRMDGDSTYFPN